MSNINLIVWDRVKIIKTARVQLTRKEEYNSKFTFHSTRTFTVNFNTVEERDEYIRSGKLPKICSYVKAGGNG